MERRGSCRGGAACAPGGVERPIGSRRLGVGDRTGWSGHQVKRRGLRCALIRIRLMTHVVVQCTNVRHKAPSYCYQPTAAAAAECCTLS